MILLSRMRSTSNSSWSSMITGGRGRSRAATGERIGRCKSELDDGEDGMKVTHGKGEFELVGSMADSQSDFEGSKMSMGEFHRWSGGANITPV